MSARPVYFGRDPGTFGLLHAAEGERSGIGVVFCPAFGWDGTASYRPIRVWATEVAADGHVALRIDLPGSGDSPGGPRDPDLFVAWQHAVADAAALIRTQPGVTRVAVVGIGLGGLLALSVLRDGATAVDDVVAWSTPARGASLVRELEAFSAFESSVLPQDGSYATTSQPSGSIDVAGYHMSAATVDALRALDLSVWDEGPLAGRRVLLLGRRGTNVDERLRSALVTAGADVATVDGSEFGKMTAEPQVARAPDDAVRSVASWLAGAPPSSIAAPPAPPVRDQLSVDVDGTRISERPVRLGVAEGEVFGVLTVPADGPGELCLLMLNAGALNHAGPNRMWVEIARRWATRGVSSLRVDLEGIGESDGDSSRYRDVASFYVPELVGQIPPILDRAVEAGMPARFVAVGLCSGAYWGLHAATRDARIEGLVMVNPRSLVWDPRVESIRAAKRLDRVVRRSTWRKFRHRGLRAFRSPSAIMGALLRQLLDAPRRAVTARRGRPDEGDELDLIFDGLRDRGTRGLLLFSGEEPLYDELKSEGRLARMDRWPNLGLHVMARSPETHTLRPAWLQRRLHDVVDQEVEGALAARREGAAPRETRGASDGGVPERSGVDG